MSDGLDSAATLSLDIDTGGAEVRLQGLLEKYEALKRVLGEQTQSGGMKTVGDGAVAATAEVKKLETQILELTATIAAMQHGGEEAAKGLKTSMSAASSALSSSLKLPDDVLVELNSRMRKAGEEAALALKNGLTNANVATTHNLLAGYEEGTVSSLERVKKKLAEAKAYLQAFGEESANIKFGSLALDTSFAAEVDAKLASLRDVYSKSAIEEQRIIMENAEAVKASQIRSSIERIRITEELAEKERRAVLESQRRSSVELVRLQEEQAEAVKASQIRSSVERIRVMEQAAEEERRQQLRDNEKRLSLERDYILASQSQRLKAAIDARKLMDAGYTGNLTTEFAPSTLSVAKSSSVADLQAQYATLNPTVANATEHQKKWNATASESHAVARGLSGSLGQLWVTYGQIAPLLAGATLGASFKSALEKGSEFEYQLTFVKALGGESAAAVRELSDAALSLGTTGMKGPVELASGMRILAQAGLNAKEAILAISSVANLAIVGEMGMEAAAVTLVGVMEAFKVDISEISHVGDVFAKAAAVSQTSVTGMTEAMKAASVVGSQYGVSMEDAATAITLLAKVNIHGTAGGTSLRNMLKELYTPGKQAADTLKMLGVTASDGAGKLKPMAQIIYELKDKLVEYDKVSQVNILQRLFGERGAKEAIQMLSLTKEAWKELHDEIANSNGFMNQVTAELETTTKGVFQQAKNILEAGMIGAFEKTDGAAHSLATSLRDLFASEKFKNDLSALVEAMSGLASILLNLAPAALYAAEAWAGWKVLSTIALGATALISKLALLYEGLSAGIAIFGATTLASGALEAAWVALTGPIGLVAAALGALYLAYKTINDSAPESVKAADRFNDAIERQIQKTKEHNEHLRERLRLMNQKPDTSDAGTASVAEQQAGIAKMQADLKDPNVGFLRKIFIEGSLGQAALKLAKTQSDIAESIAVNRAESDVMLKTYSQETFAKIEEIQAGLKYAKKNVDKAFVGTLGDEIRGMVNGLSSDMKQADLGAAKKAISDKMNELSMAANGLGGKHADFETNQKDLLHASIADLREQRKQFDDRIRYESELIKLQVQGHEISAIRAADMQGELDLRKAINDVAMAQAIRDKFYANGKSTATERATADGELARAQQELDLVRQKNNQRYETAHAQLMLAIDKQEQELLGKQQSYSQQFADMWSSKFGVSLKESQADIEKLQTLQSALMTMGETEAAEYVAKQISAKQAVLDRAEATRKLGEAIAGLKTKDLEAKTIVADLQAKFSDINTNGGNGLLNGLEKDAAKLALLNSEADTLRKTIADLEANGSEGARKMAADLKKSLAGLNKDATSGFRDLVKSLEDGLTAALNAGFANGKWSGKDFIKSIEQQLKSATFKIAVQAIVNPIMGQVSESPMNEPPIEDSGSSMGNSLSSMGGSFIGDSLLSMGATGEGVTAGIFGGTSLGGFMTGAGAALTNGAGIMGNLSAAGSLIGTGTMGGIATGIGMAMPYVAAALVIAQAAGLFGKAGGPQSGQYGDINSSGYKSAYTMSGGDSLGNQALAQSAYGQASSLFALAGKSASGLTIGQGYKLDPQGSASGVAYRNINLNGKTITGGTFDGNNGAQWVGGNSDGAGAAAYLGKLTTSEIKALVDAIGDSGLSTTIEKLSANFTDLNEGITKYLTAQAQQKALATAMMTDQEKLAQVTTDMNAGFAALGIAVPDSTAAFRELVQGIDITTQAGMDQLAGLDKLGAAYLQVTQAGQAAKDALIAEAKAKKDAIASEHKGLQDQLDNLIMSQADLLDKQRNAIDESNRSLFDQVQAATIAKAAAESLATAIRDDADAMTSATKSASEAAAQSVIDTNTKRLSVATEGASASFDVLTRAINTQKTALQSSKDSLDAVTTSIGKLKTLSGSLKSTLDGMRISGSDSAYRADAQAQIRAALAVARAGGGLPLDGELDSALKTVAQPSEQLFASFTDYARDFYGTANDIAALSDLTEAQLTTEELLQRTIKNGMYDQTSALDEILSNAKDQLDAANGINVSVLSVADALTQFGASVLSLTAERSKQGLATDASGYTQPQLIGAAATNAAATPNAGIEKWLDAGNGSQTWASGAGAIGYKSATGASSITGVNGKIASFAEAIAFVNTNLASGDLMNIYTTAKDYGVSLKSLDALMGWADNTAEDWARQQGLPVFHDGVDFVPKTGFALLERGERVIPARNNPAARGGNNSNDNAELAASLRALADRLDKIEANTRATAGHTAGTDRKLARVIPGNALITEVAV